MQMRSYYGNEGGSYSNPIPHNPGPGRREPFTVADVRRNIAAARRALQGWRNAPQRYPSITAPSTAGAVTYWERRIKDLQAHHLRMTGYLWC